MCTYTREDGGTTGAYTATYKIDEFPIYGSDRIGVYKDSAANVLFTTDYTSLTDLPEYWTNNNNNSLPTIIASPIAMMSSISFNQHTSPSNYRQATIPQIAVENLAETSSTQTTLNNSIIHSDNLATCSDYSGNILAMASNVSNLNGNKSSNALVINDASGVPYASTVGINSDANSQNTFVKVPGEDLYYLFTIGTDAKPYYHIISPTSKSVLQKNMPVDNLSGYSFSMAVIMDEAGLGSSKLFLKQYQNDSTSLYAFNFDNSGITGKTLIDKVPSKDQDLSAPMVLANDASQLAVVINKAKPRFLFRSSPNTQLRIYDITSNHDTITISDSVTFSTHNLKSLAYSQNNTYLYYQKQDKQGVADLYRYSISAQSSEAIASVSAQGKMKYANENIYIMDVEQIEVLSSTDTADIAYLPKSTISPAGSYKMSGFSASSTVAIAGPASFFSGHQGSLYTRELDFKRYELKDHLGNVRVVISDIKEPTDANFNQFTADLQSYYNYYPFGMLQPKRHYTLAEEYKFGFNGMIMDNEITGGTGEHYDFGARIYDSRLGRWMACDPLASKYPDLSPFSFVGNMPIIAIDPDGKKIILVGSEEQIEEAQELLDKIANDPDMNAIIKKIDESDVNYYILVGSSEDVVNHTGDPTAIDGGVTTYNFSGENSGVVVGVVSSMNDAEKIAALADEIQTCEQFEDKKIGFAQSPDGQSKYAIGYDVTDEVETKVASGKALAANGMSSSNLDQNRPSTAIIKRYENIMDKKGGSGSLNTKEMNKLKSTLWWKSERYQEMFIDRGFNDTNYQTPQDPEEHFNTDSNIESGSTGVWRENNETTTKTKE